jgi:hypothetical protein
MRAALRDKWQDAPLQESKGKAIGKQPEHAVVTPHSPTYLCCSWTTRSTTTSGIVTPWWRPLSWPTATTGCPCCRRSYFSSTKASSQSRASISQAVIRPSPEGEEASSSVSISLPGSSLMFRVHLPKAVAACLDGPPCDSISQFNQNACVPLSGLTRVRCGTIGACLFISPASCLSRGLKLAMSAVVGSSCSISAFDATAVYIASGSCCGVRCLPAW